MQDSSPLLAVQTTSQQQTASGVCVRCRYHERDVYNKVALSFETTVTERVSTPFQEIEVHASDAFGNILVIDDDLMLTQRDEFSYHEMLAHVPLAYLPHATAVRPVGALCQCLYV